MRRLGTSSVNLDLLLCLSLIDNFLTNLLQFVGRERLALCGALFLMMMLLYAFESILTICALIPLRVRISRLFHTTFLIKLNGGHRHELGLLLVVVIPRIQE